PVEIAFHAFTVGSDIYHAELGQRVASIAQQSHATQQGVNDHRFKRVQLQLTGFSSHGHGHVGTDHFKGNLVDHFRDHGVDLTGHDGRTSLRGGQTNFTHTGTRTAREQPQVVGQLGQLDGSALQYARQVQKTTAILSCFDQVGRHTQLNTGQIGQGRDSQLGILGVSRNASPNSRTAQVHVAHQFARFFQAHDVFVDH